MTSLNLLPRDEVTYDVAGIGEVMLRLDPGDFRIHTARQFTPWEGGGEYNTVRGLSTVFGQRATFLTALVDNPVGRLIENLISTSRVDVRHINWVQADAMGRSARNGLNFTERGFGVRGAVGLSDRCNTAISQMTPEQLPADVFAGGVRWFHTGGIYAALSNESADTMLAAIKQAKEAGAVVSYDFNYRSSLWDAHPDPERLRAVNREVVELADVLFATRYDLATGAGVDLGEQRDNPDEETEAFASALIDAFPNIALVARTQRTVPSASCNTWAAQAFSTATGLITTETNEIDIFDRVGGGDSFAAGLIFGLLEDYSLQEALRFGLIHGALAMSTPGDWSMATKQEVIRLAAGDSAAVKR